VVVDGELRGLFRGVKTCHYFEVYFSRVPFRDRWRRLMFRDYRDYRERRWGVGAYPAGCEKPCAGLGTG
jgi:hypothetical protein